MVTGKAAVFAGTTAAVVDGVTAEAVSTAVRTEDVRTGTAVIGGTSGGTTVVVTSVVVMSGAVLAAARTVIGKAHGDMTAGISGAPGVRTIVGGSVVTTTVAVIGGGSAPRMSVPRTAVMTVVASAGTSVPRT
ncbi:hypothetical protein V1L54_29295, partial [Streptomyces sp. TRM 70361]|nr:hypothetical protein [Streptomyces sp. TRM 70361]